MEYSINDNKIRFECGCEFDYLGQRSDGSIKIKIQPDLRMADFNINFDCPATYELMKNGFTKGVFQLEKPLGRQIVKKLLPNYIGDVFALGSLLRPGATQSKDENGVSSADHYCLQKNGLEELTVVPEAISKIVEDTYNQIIYQEQAMAIAQKVAGFNLIEVDRLRKCVTGDTMFVSKTRGWISIDELLETNYDDEFLTMNENGVNEWKRIDEIWYTGKKDVVRVETNNGLYVDATKYHQFLTHDGWKARIRLTTDDYMVCAREIDFDGCDEIPLSLCIVIAGMVTEGYFNINSSGPTAHFTNFDKGMMDVFLNNFQSYFLHKPQTNNPNIAHINRVDQGVLLKYIKYGLAATKELPTEMMRTTKDTCREFLSYMLSAEGGVTKKNGNFEFSSTSHKLARQVQLLLKRFAIRSNVYVNNKSGYKDKNGNFVDCGPAYRVYINDKEEQLKLLNCGLTKYWPKYKVDDLVNSINSRKPKSFTKNVLPPNIVKMLGNQYPYVMSYESGSVYSQNISIGRFGRLCEKSKDPFWIKFYKGNHYYDKLECINKRIRQQKTYDFRMKDESTPYVIANGMVIHNSAGKKDASEMSKIEKLFMERVAQLGIITVEEGQKIFASIKASQRYSFNKSHATGYGITTYITAYIKTHLPLESFLFKLKLAKNEQNPLEEIDKFIEDAKLHDISVLPPDITKMNADFWTDRKDIYFGITDIKGVGKSQFEKLSSMPVATEWIDFLMQSNEISKTVVDALIRSGALRCYGLPRKQMLEEYRIVNNFTKTTIELAQKIHQQNPQKNLVQLLESILHLPDGKNGLYSKSRPKIESELKLLKNPPSSLNDTHAQIVAWEIELLGVAVSSGRIATAQELSANTTIKELLTSVVKYPIICAQIIEVRQLVTRRGKNPGSKMCSLLLEDNTSKISAVVFPDTFEQIESDLVTGSTLYFNLDRLQDGGYQVKKVWNV